MKTIKDISLDKKRVLVRVDYNVPIKNGRIVDDFKIKQSLPTIKYLMKKKCKIILVSHLGRPNKKEAKYRMKPIALRLAKLLNKEIYYSRDTIGKNVKDFIDWMKKGDIVVLENIRFYKGEEENNQKLAKELSKLCDVFVNDAFAVSHRNHASVVGITKYVPSVAGLLLEKEVKHLKELLKPKKPFVVLLGGSKLSTKLHLIKELLKKADKILIGGAIIFTFLKAQGKETGKSLIEQDFVKEAKQLLKNKKIILPEDYIIAKDINSKTGKNKKEIQKNMMGLDIGKETTKKYLEELKKAKTIFWNGPLGYIENKIFAKSTTIIAKELSKMKKTIIIGGTDTIKLINKLKLKEKYTFVSTGGGASLDFIAKGKLPGIEALKK